MDADADDIATGINYCLHKGGQNSPTSDLPMGGFKHTGVGLATVRTDYATCGQVQDGKFKYNTTKGSLNAYTLALQPTLTGYVTGQVFYFKADRTSSGTATLNIDGVGAKSIYVNGAISAAGDIVTGRMYSVVYDGAYFHLISAGSGSGASYGGARIYLSSNAALTHSTYTTVQFRSEDYDDSDYYPGSVDYLAIPADGRYRITAGIRTSMIGAYDHQGIYIIGVFKKNGSSMMGSATASSVASEWGTYYYMPLINMTWEGTLEEDDQITLSVFQRNLLGADIYVVGSATVTNATYMAIERIK